MSLDARIAELRDELADAVDDGAYAREVEIRAELTRLVKAGLETR